MARLRPAVLLAAALSAACAGKPAYLLVDSAPQVVSKGTVEIHKFGFGGAEDDFHRVIVLSPEAKEGFEALLEAAAPAVKTTVETVAEFEKGFEKKDDPMLAAVQQALTNGKTAVVVSYRNDRRRGLWSRLWGK